MALLADALNFRYRCLFYRKHLDTYLFMPTLDKENIFVIIFLVLIAHRDVAQLGRALPWGGRGREFKSRRSDHLSINQMRGILL